jgi:hypothetical protein
MFEFPLMVVMRRLIPNDQQLYNTKYKRYTSVRKMMDKAHPPPQVATEAEFRY